MNLTHPIEFVHRPQSADRARGVRGSFFLTVLLGLTALLTSCASTGKGDELAARVTMRQFTGNAISIELRSESHTDAVDFYSRARDTANVKIVPDGLMDALLRDLEQYHFDDFAQPGPGPSNGLSGATKVIEVEVDGVVRHVASHPNASNEQRSAVVGMATFLSLAFSNVRGFQSIEDAQNKGAFSGSGPGIEG
ncbi:hypothetical protein [Engelhardtia mirabilis]|uniref:hypothetical protein n=1 Tax=Engelhardtia mirabilis TaxID=2528011 RepID=UPI0011A344B9